MKYIRQFLIIIGVSCVGELLNYLIPLPIPASIYGLVIMLGLLISKKLKLKAIKETADFLINIMPIMFIPASVGLIAYWEQLQPFLIPVIVITVLSTIFVMIATGKITDFILKTKEDK
jgi:holin-like protein